MKERPSGTREHILSMLEKYKEQTAAMIRAETNGDDNDDSASPSQDFTHETHSPYVPDMDYYSDDESDYQDDTGYNVARYLFDLASTVFSQGPNGLENLKIIAWGDFTNRLPKGHRSLERNIILTRDNEDELAPGFRVIELEDLRDAAPFVDRPGEFLKACDLRFSEKSRFPGR